MMTKRRMLAVVLLGKMTGDGSRWQIMPNIVRAKEKYPQTRYKSDIGEEVVFLRVSIMVCDSTDY